MNDLELSLFTLIIFGAVFALVLALGGGWLKRPSQDVIDRRLSFIDVRKLDDPEINLLRDRFRSRLSWFDRWLIRFPGMERHVDYGSYTASITKLRHQALWSLGLFFISTSLVSKVSQTLLAPIGIGLITAWLPFLRLNWLAGKRLAAFETQLPEALDSITRALRAGYPLMEAIRLVSDEMSEPLGTEFKILFDEVNAGIDIRHAFMTMRSRVPSVSLMAFMTSVLLQRETGGDLTETLGKISLIIRKRFTYQRNVKTLTAEGRMSGWVMGLLPFGIFAVTYIMDPAGASLLLNDPEGRRLLFSGLGFLLVGSIWIRRIIDVEA
jgi:tight adherence protein B